MGQDRDANTLASQASSSPLGVYVHIPFCEKKCFYCDFYSLENHSQRGAFIDALVKELSLFGEKYGRRKADTIFFGGGTPSLLTPSELGQILSAIDSSFQISENLEFTLECNPGTVDTAYLSEYRSLGVNRLSFGVQSFFDDELKFLSRIHSAEEAVSAVDRARHAGFHNINIDMIYALPGQTTERLLENLTRAVSLGTEHISAYSLIVEPGTPLNAAVEKGEITPSLESTEMDMYEVVMEFMEKNGFIHYEISNYSRPGYRCRHNLKYWNAEHYVSFGPSAHSYLDGQRWWNVSSLATYLSELNSGIIPVSVREKLTHSQLLDEFVLLHLRQGFLNIPEFAAIFSASIPRSLIAELETAGYCNYDGEMIQLTKSGFKVSDEISARILSRISSPT